MQQLIRFNSFSFPYALLRAKGLWVGMSVAIKTRYIPILILGSMGEAIPLDSSVVRSGAGIVTQQPYQKIRLPEFLLLTLWL